MKRVNYSTAMSMMAIALATGLQAYQLKAELSDINYQSRGKGGKRPVRPSGVAKSKRAAVKARNVIRSKRAA